MPLQIIGGGDRGELPRQNARTTVANAQLENPRITITVGLGLGSGGQGAAIRASDGARQCPEAADRRRQDQPVGDRELYNTAAELAGVMRYKMRQTKDTPSEDISDG